MPFVKGQSGNPSGRPKLDPKLREMAQAHTERCLEVAVACLDDPNAAIRLKAVEVLLDRGHGKAHQTSDMNVNVGIGDVLSQLPVTDDPTGSDSTVA